MAFGRKKPATAAEGPKTSTKVAALWVRDDQGTEKTSGVLLNGLGCRVYENDYKKLDKDPNFKIVAYLPKGKDPAICCQEAFATLEQAFKDLGVDVDKALDGPPAAADVGGDDVPF
jgi:hypothetical protein